MKKATSEREWLRSQHARQLAAEKAVIDEEISVAKSIQRAVPELTWGQAMSEACRIIRERK